ncbi:MAG: hypothetical protein AB7W28_08030 [Armatimonadota bacterium]
MFAAVDDDDSHPKARQKVKLQQRGSTCRRLDDTGVSSAYRHMLG